MAVFMRAGNQALRTAVITEGDDVAIAWGTVQNRWTPRNNYDPIFCCRRGYGYVLPAVLLAMEDMDDAWSVTAVLVGKKGTAAAAAAAEAARDASVAAANAVGALGVINDDVSQVFKSDQGRAGYGVDDAFRASSRAALAMAEVAVDAEEVEDWQYISRKWTEATEDRRWDADNRAAEAAARTQSVFASYW